MGSLRARSKGEIDPNQLQDELGAMPQPPAWMKSHVSLMIKQVSVVLSPELGTQGRAFNQDHSFIK